MIINNELRKEIYENNLQDILKRISVIDLGNIDIEKDTFHLIKDNYLNVDNIQNYEKSHSQLFPKKENNDKNNIFFYEEDSFIELNNKTNFIKDSFYNQIISKKETKESFEKINSDKNFQTKFNTDRNNSSVYFCVHILKEIDKNGKMKEIQEKLNNQINNLTSFQKENISLISNIYQAPKEIKEIKYYKKVKPNGDSFYISFIYQYVKNLIPEDNGSIITRIINLEREYHILDPINNGEIDISKLGSKYLIEAEDYNFQELKNLGQAFNYLGIIYNLITAENDIINATKMFDLAFCYDKTFWKLLCLFMKSYIKNFLRKNSDMFTIEEYSIKNNIIPKKYFSGKDNKFNYESYLNDNVTINQKEPTLFIISIIPYIFNVSLNLYINEESNFQLNKIEINPDEGEMDINILYSSYSYHIVECNKDDYLDINIKSQFDICNIFNYTLNNEAKIDILKDEYINSYKEGKCLNCKKDDYIKIKSLGKNYKVCLNCLKYAINNVLINRYNNMKKEKFNYIEYYLKEIPILYLENTNDYIYLSSIEFFYIFNQNIFTYFRNLINNICENCKQYSQEKKIIHKICGCKICINCAKKECDNKIFLNNFEKNYIYKNKIIECKCGKNIEMVNYSSQVYNLLNSDEKYNYEKEADIRIKKYIEKYCMGCGSELDKVDIGENKKMFYSYNFVVNYINNDNENIEHRLCQNCSGKLQNNKEKNINCIICNKTHLYNKKISKSTIINLQTSKIFNNIENNIKEKLVNKSNDNEKKRRNKDGFNICYNKCIIH